MIGVFEELCQIAHKSLVLGKCPWCGHTIADGVGQSPTCSIQITVKQSHHELDEGEAEAMKKALSAYPDALRKMVSSLIGVLKHQKTTVRWGAAICLGNLGPEAREALPTLRLLLQDRNHLVRRAAEEAIKRIEG